MAEVETEAVSSHRIISLDAGEIDRVEFLWKEMVSHHREVVAGAWPVRSEEEAWARRRREYREMLDGGGTMFAAVPDDDPDADPDGYAVLTIGPPGPTWDMGEQVGEIESLSVAAAVRGLGVGTMLIEACREALREQGIAYWSVAVVEANEGAAQLYGRAGFEPFYSNLMGRVDGP